MSQFYLKRKLSLTLFTIAIAILCNAQSFTPGNVAVIVAAASATNTTASLVELNPNLAGQTPVTSRNIDGTTLPNSLRFSGSATSTLYLTNSDDGSLIAFSGGNTTTSGATNINTILPRGVGTFNAAGTFNLAATYTGANGNQARSATTINNSNWFIGDQGGVYTNGTSAPSPALNLRGIKSFGGIAYVSQASGTATNIQVSTLSALTAGTVTGLLGLTNNASLQDYYLISSGSNGTSFDVLYVLSATSNTAGSITKFSLVSGSWVSNGSYVTTFGGFGLAAKKNGAGADLFVSTGQGALTANNLLKINDAAGYNVAINITTANNVILYTSPVSTIIKGVAFAPVAVVANPNVSLSVSSNTGSEASQTVITVTATASAAVIGAQTVDLAVTGTRITTGDYTLSNTTITIPNGTTTGTVTFTVVDDILVESTETATLTISNPSAGFTLGTPVTQNIVITDNDVALPTVNLSVSSNTGSEQNATVITVTATASAAVSGNQTVTLGISGTGITPSDYVLTGTTITILNGATTGTQTFIIRNDAETEGTETSILTISNASAGITLGTTLVQNVAITDNICQPLIRKSTSTSSNGAEISAFDSASKRIYTVAGLVMEYYTLSNAGILSAPSILSFGFTSPGNSILPNSVAIRNGIVAVSYAIVDANNAQQIGKVAFYNAATGAYINDVNVGYLPDMVTFTPDGTKVLTANEGEPNSYGQGTSFDPEGSISIIDISGGVASATVQTAGFTSFNSQINTLRTAGVRIYGPGATVAMDLEPEYITFSADGTQAIVTLQENNAIAQVDIATATVTNIYPLGYKNHNITGNGIDASDQDGPSINIQQWPVLGMYQPDGIASFNVGGVQYYITANEGDSRAYTGFDEESRVSTLTLDPTAYPTGATLKLNQNLGRLQLTNATGDIDNDGDIDQLHAYGARSFSIWNSSFGQVYDSGDQLEQITAAQNPRGFNGDPSAPNTPLFDTRSDNKGPEPESVTTGVVNGVLYAFVNSERTGDIFVYDITNPTAPVFKQYIDNPEDRQVEGVLFIPAIQSPTGNALIIASAELSRTVTVYEFSNIAQNLVPTNTTQTTSQTATTTYGDCVGLIAKVNQSGANPITGFVTSSVWIETSVPSSAGQPFVQRHYEITPTSGASTATGRVTLYFTQAEFNNFNNDPASSQDLPTGPADATGISNLRVLKYPGTSGDGSGLPASYTGAPSGIDPADADIIWNTTASRWEVSFNVIGFSGFFVQTNLTILPVRWLSVVGNLNTQKQAVISWKVQETNAASYSIEKSIDGRIFVAIGNTTSLSDGENNYQFTEETALQNTSYYRIKQIDRDGRYSYSSIIKLSNLSSNQLTIFPNPVKDIVTISIGASSLNNKAQLTDISGQVLQSFIIKASSFTVDMSSYSSGVYLLKLGDGQTGKILKK